MISGAAGQRIRLGVDPAPRSAFNVGLIEGGSSVNAIPQTARAKVDIRSESNQKMDELVDLLASAVERAREAENQRATGGKVTSRLKDIGARPAASIEENAPILQDIRSVDAHLGIRSHLDCSSTDANIPMSLGLPAIAIGAGGAGGGAHTTEEWYRPDGRDLALKRIFLTLLLLLNEPRPLKNPGTDGTFTGFPESSAAESAPAPAGGSGAGGRTPSSGAQPSCWSRRRSTMSRRSSFWHCAFRWPRPRCWFSCGAPGELRTPGKPSGPGLWRACSFSPGTSFRPWGCG